jgi:hypothetical protein
MNLTTKQLKQIIKEELEIVLEGTLADIRPEDWFEVYNGCMREGVPILGINADDEDRCTDLAAQVQSGNYDYETVKAHLAYEQAQNRQEPEEKSHHADEMYFDLVKRDQKRKRQWKQEDKRKAQIKEEWSEMAPDLKQWKAKEYIKKANAQFWKIRDKIVEIRKTLRLGRNDDWRQLEDQIGQLEEMQWYRGKAEKYFENIKGGKRLNEPLPNAVRDWIYKCRYEKEDFYCM